MANEGPVVTVWLGRFASEERLEAYFEETYGDDEDDERPISEFAREQDETFYDHDFVERSFREATSSVRALLRGHSYASSFIAPVESRACELGLSDLNAVVLVWDRQVKSPRSVRGPDYELQCIGTFPCDPSASSG
jgi:hypothetical protein